MTCAIQQTDFATPLIDLSFQNAMLAARPRMRGYALSLCRKADQADDLTQETMVKALANQARFVPGSDLHGWLFTILRNHFLGQLRRQKREVQDVDGNSSARLRIEPAHDAVLDLRDFRAALGALPQTQRQALLLVGALGHSCEQAARLAGCQPGTVKSRVSRARQTLISELKIEGARDYISALPSCAPVRHQSLS